MVVMSTTIISQESLENIAETPGVDVPTIWAMELGTIVASSFWMSIDVLLEVFRETMRPNATRLLRTCVQISCVQPMSYLCTSLSSNKPFSTSASVVVTAV